MRIFRLVQFAAFVAALSLLGPADGQEPPTIRKVRELVHDAQVGGAGFSADGSQVVTCGWDGTVRTWDARTGDAKDTLRVVVEVKLKGDPNDRLTLENAEKAKRIDTVLPWGKGAWLVRRPTVDGFELWEPAKKKLGPPFSVPGGEIVAHQVTGPGAGLVLAGENVESPRPPEVWDLKTRKKLKTLAGVKHWVGLAVFSANGKRLVTHSSADKSTRVWDVTTGKPLHQLGGGTDIVTAVAVSADGKRAVTAFRDLRVWDLETGREVRRIDVGRDLVNHQALAITADGRRAAALTLGHAPGDKAVMALRVFDLDAGKEVARADRTYEAENQADLCLELSPDGRLAVTFRGPRESIYKKETRAATVWELPPPAARE